MRRLALLAMVVAAAGCGKKGALIYPDMLVPAAPGKVVAEQSGTAIRLAIDVPDKDRAGRKLLDLSGIRVWRRDAAPTIDPTCRACQSDYRLFRRIFLDAPESAQRVANRLVLFDSDIVEGRSYTYLVKAFTREGVDGAPAASSVVIPLAPVPPPQLQLSAAPTELVLEFSGAPSADATMLGYNLYRSVKGEPYSYLPLNRQPVTGLRFNDSGLARGVTYRYVARMVVERSGTKFEGLASNEVEGAMLDDE